MKLYATVTSERASKGQGGNKRLDTIITDEKRNQVAKILIQINDNNTLTLRYWDNTASGATDYSFTSNPRIETKGNKQKGDCKCPKDYHDMFVNCRGY